MTESRRAASDSPAARIRGVLGTVEHVWTLGWISCQVAKRFQMHRTTDDYLSSSWLHQMAHVACEREAMMCIARLTDTSSETISIYKLLNIASSKPGAFVGGAERPGPAAGPKTTVADVNVFVVESRAVLKARSETLRRIRATRDKELAHTDKAHLADPSQLARYHVNDGELEEVLLEIRGITESCRRLLDNSTLCVDNIGEDLDREFESLLEAYQALRDRILAEIEERRKAGPWAPN